MKPNLSRRSLVLGGTASAAAAALLAGCSTDKNVAAAATGGPLGAAKNQKFYWVTANLSDPFYKDGIAGMKEFAKLFGVQVEVVGPQANDIAAMTKAFEETLAKPDVKGIFSYYYGDFAAAKPLYEQAAKQGIPVVNGAGDWGPPRLAFCGVRDQDAPSAAVDVIGKALGGQGKVGYIGNTGDNIIREEKFFEQLLAQRFPNMQFAGHATHNGSATDALAQYQNFVGAHKDLSAMFFGDGLGPSIVQGLVDAAPNVKIVLRGFGKNGLQAIKDGKVLATVDRSTFDEEFWGFMPLYFAVNGGYRGPDTMLVPIITVTKDNIDAFLTDPYRSATKYVSA